MSTPPRRPGEGEDRPKKSPSKPLQLPFDLSRLLKQPHVHGPRAPHPPRPPRPPRQQLDKKNLGTRAVTGLSLAAFTIWLVWVRQWAFSLEVVVFASIGVQEMCNLFRRKGLRPYAGLARVAGTVVVAAATFAPIALLGHILALSLLGIMICSVFRVGDPSDGRKPGFVDAAVTAMAVIYVPWLFSFALLVRRVDGVLPMRFAGHDFVLECGTAYLLLLIACITLCDVGCYAFGKAFGRTPLAPRLSPGKTIEGSLGGLLVSTGIALGFGALAGISPSLTVPYGLAIGIFAQLGDLWESMMKREAGVKDSGNAIAGHGGVLDRFDSFFFAAPVAYFLTICLLVPR